MLEIESRFVSEEKISVAVCYLVFVSVLLRPSALLHSRRSEPSCHSDRRIIY
jgi:hypothetical protein